MRGFERKKFIWVSLCLLLILFDCTLEVASQTTAAVPTTGMPINKCVTGCECSPRNSVGPTTVDCSGRGFTEVPVDELLILVEIGNVTVAHL